MTTYTYIWYVYIILNGVSRKPFIGWLAMACDTKINIFFCLFVYVYVYVRKLNLKWLQ